MMNETIEMEYIPPEIWRGVRNKWISAINSGWHQKLWYRCDLCNWMRKSEFDCSACPLHNRGWCRGDGEESRLHIVYHRFNQNDWIRSIRAFLDLIEPHCGEEK